MIIGKFSVHIEGCHSNIQRGIFLKLRMITAELMTSLPVNKKFYIVKEICAIALCADNWQLTLIMMVYIIHIIIYYIYIYIYLHISIYIYIYT